MRRWVVGSVGGSERGWSIVFVALGVRRVSYFYFLDPWWFHRSLSTSTTAVYVICCAAAVIHGGWVDRFVGVTVLLRSAVLL